ncbi:MAG TPA: hypothetical protein VJ011_12395 [Steroidobacteraceae bacterium]|nr:hypothetical protein [Steroidobacteraceae bacterium]
MPETLPDSVRALLRDHIESYEQLELLLLLRGRPGGIWTLREIAQRMQLPDEELEEALRGLRAAGCLGERIQGDDAIRYAPRDAGQAVAIEGLAAAYGEKPLAIIKLMSANAIERVRTAAINTFADAFVVGGKKDG